MNDHLLERQAYLERQPARRRRRVAEAKRASGLARQIGDQVRRRRWLPGRRIGFEPGLTLRYGVSRSIFREAVRMLEQHGIAEMRRGIRGGLYISEPDPSAVVLSASVYLAHIGLEAENVHEVRLSLEPLAASLAAERASKKQLESLAASLERELACGDDEFFREARTLHEQIADLCGNRALALFIRVVITAAWGDAEVEPANLPGGWRDQLRANHEKLVRAIKSGDPRGARKCMEEHLDTTTGWWVGLHSPS